MEFVYVVQRERLFDLHYPHGLVACTDRSEEARRYLQRIEEHGFFVERRKAELDSGFKQIIPYVVMRSGDRVLLLQRTNRQGETRLHGKLSIGIGGHINPIDGNGIQVLQEGMQRELEEELTLSGPLDYRICGFLNDDATEVGAVHFGMVAVADTGGRDVTVRETEQMEGRWVSVDELVKLHETETDRFESWSSLLIARLDAVLAAELRLEQVRSATGL